MKASIFDLDGTLTLKNKFLMTNFSRYLTSKNIFPKSSFDEIEKSLKLYFKNNISYREAAFQLTKVYSTALKGVKINVIEKEAEKFVNEEVIKEYLYHYTKALVKLMKNYGITIGISGAPKEVVEFLGKYLKFDLCYGTELEVENGICTGKMKLNLIIKETKEAILEKIIKEKNINLSESFGFGDTDQDLSFLSKVGTPIALNPDVEMLKLFKKNKWLFFTSKDDVVKNIKKILKENIK
jgi:HAD superfamily hydrolase (TIGR01490 family)